MPLDDFYSTRRPDGSEGPTADTIGRPIMTPGPGFGVPPELLPLLAAGLTRQQVADALEQYYALYRSFEYGVAAIAVVNNATVTPVPSFTTAGDSWFVARETRFRTTSATPNVTIQLEEAASSNFYSNAAVSTDLIAGTGQRPRWLSSAMLWPPNTTIRINMTDRGSGANHTADFWLGGYKVYARNRPG